MNVVQLTDQFELASINWNFQLSSEEKINILRSIFRGTLENVNFWKLYKVVKKLKSQ